MRCALYIRQSDSGGYGTDSLSVASQESELRARCEREGWSVVAVETEADVRGWQDESERPGLSRVLDLASRGEIELVLVFDLSRLARSLEMQERWIRVLGRMGVEVESHTEPEVRRSTLLRQIKGAIAEEKTREIRAHVRRSMRERAERGLTHGPPPFGYRREPKSLLEPDPETAPVVRRVFQMRADGASTEEIRVWLDNSGVASPNRSTHWTWQVVNRMLQNPAYRGTVRSGPVIAERAHEPIVDDALWHAAQARATRHNLKPVYGERTTWLAGLVFHSCGARATLTRATKGKQYPYFRCYHTASWLTGRRDCTDRPVAMSSRLMEAAVWPQVLDVLSRLRPAADILADAKRRYKASAPDAMRELRLAESAAERARERLQRAETLYLEARRSREWFDAEEARAKAEIAEADARVAATPQPPDRARIDAQLAALRSLRDAAAGLQDADKARLVRTLGHVVYGNGPPRLVLDEDIAALVRPALLPGE